MLKKVSGAAGAAKDKLKQRRHQGQNSSRRGHHSRPSTNTIVSLSAVDNAAFEDILDDDTDFMADINNHTPSSGPVVPPTGPSPAKSQTSLPSGSSESDLFDDALFQVKENDRGETEEVKEEAAMSCDPLSGQILSTPGAPEDSDNGSPTNPHEEMAGITETKGENELETSWNGDLETKQERADVFTEGLEVTDGRESGLESSDNQHTTDLQESQTEFLQQLSDDKLFDDDIPPSSRPIPIASTSDITPSALTTQDSAHKREFSMNSESGLSTAMSDSSFFNSFPSSLENELVRAVHSQCADDHQLESKSPPHDSPPLFSSDKRNASEEEVASQSSTVVPAADDEPSLNGPTDVESELEMLLATPKKIPAVTKEDLVKEEEEGVAQVGGSSEKERGSGHLDSGVFDPVVVDSDGTPEREREQTRVAGASTGDEMLTIKTDYFSTSPALKRPQSKSSDSQTSLSQTAENTHSYLSVSQQTKPRPPRPPPPSPGSSRKTKNNQMSHEPKEAHASQRHSPNQSTPISKSAATVKLLDDELFPDDVKKVSEVSAPITEGSSNRGVTHLASSRQTSDKSLTIPHVSVNESTTASEGSAKEVTEDEYCDCKEELSSKSEVIHSESEGSQFHLTWPYHCLLAFLLYLYYSLNVFPYLAGLFAGFFTLFLCLGSVFIYYVHFIEAETNTKKEKARRITLSDDFVQTMGVDFSKLGKYESRKFTAVLTYDHTTHHPNNRMYTELKFQDNFKLHIKVHDSSDVQHHVLFDMVDLRQCKITLEPPEVAQNRKRRWSKKFPIVITSERPNPAPLRLTKVYLFSPTAREKEDWFRRFRYAGDGVSTDKLIQQQKVFFGYMEKYFPSEMLRNISLFPSQRSAKKPPSNRSGSSSKKANHQKILDNTRVQFSKGMDTDELSDDTELSGGVNISHHDTNWSANSSSNRRTVSPQSSSTLLKSATPPPRKRNAPTPPPRPRSPVQIRHHENDFEIVDYPPANGRDPSKQLLPSPNSMDLWLNSLAARLCWDVWHEQRWKDWIMTRIQKKLFKTKTPWFMEKLQLIDVDIGMDMPVVKRRVGGPRLDLRGIWIYLDVTYQGKFVMTIETKMKFKKNASTDEQGTEKDGKQMTSISNKSSSRAGVPVDSPVSGSWDNTKSRSMSHSRAARALGGGGNIVPGGDEADEEDEIDSGSDDDEQQVSNPLMEEELVEARESLDHQSDTPLSEHSTGVPVPVATGNKGKLKSMMYKVAKKVVNTKIVQRAKEKVSSYPLILTVEVIKLDGILAVNIPPPKTDTIWWGFHENPKLELVAKPRLGHREVKLSKVTHWIERKLCDIVNKKLVYPEMEDLVIPLLNSGMAEDKLRPIPADSSGSNVSEARVK